MGLSCKGHLLSRQNQQQGSDLKSGTSIVVIVENESIVFWMHARSFKICALSTSPSLPGKKKLAFLKKTSKRFGLSKTMWYIRMYFPSLHTRVQVVIKHFATEEKKKSKSSGV